MPKLPKRWKLFWVIGSISLILFLGAVGWQFHMATAQRRDTCVQVQDLKTSLQKIANQLKPAGKIRKPGETDEQYAFRLKQQSQVYKVLTAGLKVKSCD